MHFPSLFVFLVYISFYLTLIFALICLACGLYYMIDLTEEHTTLTKKLIKHASTVLLAIHPLLFLYEKLPFLPCFIGLLAHISHHLLLQTFPYISPSSPSFVMSLVLFCLSNFAWINTFRDHEIFYQYRVAPLPATIAFMLLVVWLVPAAILCSLTSNDNVLPGAAPSEEQKYQRRKNAIMTTLESISNKVKKLLGMGQQQNNLTNRDPYTYTTTHSSTYMR